jgi:hypothetical protein
MFNLRFLYYAQLIDIKGIFKNNKLGTNAAVLRGEGVDQTQEGDRR